MRVGWGGGEAGGEVWRECRERRAGRSVIPVSVLHCGSGRSGKELIKHSAFSILLMSKTMAVRMIYIVLTEGEKH